MISKQLHECFSIYRNITTTLIRISKEKYYKSFFKENKKNSKKLWEDIQSITNVKNGKFPNNVRLDIDNETTIDDLTIKNQLNKFFMPITKNLVTKLPKKLKSFKSYLKNANENCISHNEERCRRFSRYT